MAKIALVLLREGALRDILDLPLRYVGTFERPSVTQIKVPGETLTSGKGVCPPPQSTKISKEKYPVCFQFLKPFFHFVLIPFTLVLNNFVDVIL